MKSKEEIKEIIRNLLRKLDLTDNGPSGSLITEAITTATEPLEKERSELLKRTSEFCPVCNYMRSAASVCKCGKLSETNQQKDKERDTLREKLGELEESHREYNAGMALSYAELQQQLAQANEAKEREEKDRDERSSAFASIMLCAKENWQEHDEPQDVANRIIDSFETMRNQIVIRISDARVLEHQLAESKKQCTELRADKEKAERRKAEMRDALSGSSSLLAFLNGAFGDQLKEKDQTRLTAQHELNRKALADNAGSSFVPLAELKEARELLEKVEWVGYDFSSNRNYCWHCKNNENEGHAKDCKLQAFLAK